MDKVDRNRLPIADLVGQDDWPAVNHSGRPFVVYKFGATLDGRIAAADATSQWITSEDSRAEVHLLRAGCQATVIGSGTQQADNPNLSVRATGDPRLDASQLSVENQPYRVVVDSAARTPSDAKVLNDAAPTFMAVAEDADARHLEGKATVIRIPRSSKGLDLRSLLTALHERGVRGVLLEGGPTLGASFVAAGLVDRYICYVAPALLGAGKPAMGDVGIRTMQDILRLELIRVDQSGPDVRIIARPKAR